MEIDQEAVHPVCLSPVTYIIWLNSCVSQSNKATPAILRRNAGPSSIHLQHPTVEMPPMTMTDSELGSPHRKPTPTVPDRTGPGRQTDDLDLENRAPPPSPLRVPSNEKP